MEDQPSSKGYRSPSLDRYDLDQAAAAFADFCKTIAALRDKDTGCPWDLKQDHRSLRRYMIEEAYEAVEAMAEESYPELCDELGDVLLQVVLNAQVAQDREAFCITDVIGAIDRKMRRRHPHVFGTEEQRRQRSIESIKRTWEQIKQDEAGGSKAATESGAFAKAQSKHPSTAQAYEIGKIAARIGFDWEHPGEVFDQVCSEIEELRAELNHHLPDRGRLADELGDVFFSLAQLARHLGFDPEIINYDANRKFLKRFHQVEEMARDEGLTVEAASRDKLEELWKRAKKALKKGP